MILVTYFVDMDISLVNRFLVAFYVPLFVSISMYSETLFSQVHGTSRLCRIIRTSIQAKCR